MQVFGPIELFEDVIQSGFCVGCGACVNLCPYLKTYNGKTSMLFPCTCATGRCYSYCPKCEVDLNEVSFSFSGKPYSGEPLGSYKAIYMAKAGSAVKANHFQDGGTVSALMQFALTTNQIDAAVLTGKKGIIPSPGLATNANEVENYATSKYMTAPTLAALNEGINHGYSRMGIVATPCQLTAVAQMRTNPTPSAKFVDPIKLTIGLFCTWALDTRKFLPLIEERLEGQEVRKMKIPPPPDNVLIIETDQQKIAIPLEKIRPLIPTGCKVCPDMTAEWADISVGAMEEFYRWNTLVVRTDYGEKLVKDAVEAGYLVLEDFSKKSLLHLEKAAAGKKKRSLIKASKEGLVNTERGKRSVLRLSKLCLEKIIGNQKDTQ